MLSRRSARVAKYLAIVNGVQCCNLLRTVLDLTLLTTTCVMRAKKVMTHVFRQDQLGTVATRSADRQRIAAGYWYAWRQHAQNRALESF
jgi:hypothetical protein